MNILEMIGVLAAGFSIAYGVMWLLTKTLYKE